MANYHASKKRSGNKETQVAVVMVPFLGPGHLNQLLHLSRLISDHKVQVHCVGTTTHNRQARDRVHGFDTSAITNLHFHDLPTPYFPNMSPDPNSSEKFPSHFVPTFSASTQLREPVFDLLKSLSNKARRIIVIYDSLMSYVVQDMHSVPNTESFCFQSVSAFTLFSFFWEDVGKPVVPTEAYVLNELPSLEGCFTREFVELSALQLEAKKHIQSGNIYNSNRVIEGLYLDMLVKTKHFGGEKHWALVPFNPVIIQGKVDSDNHHKCLEWLEKQPPNSVILVSFGTTTLLSNEQIRELALGLENSGHKFIWVLRDADKGDIFAGEVRKVELPEGFEERVAQRGIIVRDWAPQLEILGHPSTGGFMSHCGWNSCMESISMGVPVATWPMHSDQPRNALFLTKVLKIGLEVRGWVCRDEVVSSVRVEEVVKRFMGSAEGDEMRERAKELGSAIKQSVVEGGAASLEMSSFIAHITR